MEKMNIQKKEKPLFYRGFSHQSEFIVCKHLNSFDFISRQHIQRIFRGGCRCCGGGNCFHRFGCRLYFFNNNFLFNLFVRFFFISYGFGCFGFINCFVSGFFENDFNRFSDFFYLCRAGCGTG